MSTTPSAPLPLHRMAIFTPGRQTDDEIKASFIAREAVLERILDDIRTTRPGSIPQHHIIIGQRGMGKTTLLRRLHVALREKPLAQLFIPLGFPEEQYSVDRLSTVFLNCLDSLADTLEQEDGSPDLITKIDEAVERLRKDRADEEIVAQDAERTLLAFAAEIGRRPVLLVDNLGLIFERLKKPELHALRAFLMKGSAPIVIGASSQVLDQDYAAPFFDHFKPHHLSRLSFDEMREVLLRLAERTGNTDIPARLDQESGRLHALHALTGGNPRTTRILFDVFSHGFSQEAYQDLETLLDWMTPLYKARFEELSPQAQIVVSAIATMWEPVVISRICEETRLQPNQISPQLDRLKKADVIEEVTVDPPDRTGPIPDQRTPRDRTGYQISERFFNIWFLMRQATRRDKRNLIYLTRFIECLHSTGEREQFAKELLDQPALNKSQKIYALALEQSLQDRHLKLRLHDHIESEFIKAQREKVEELEDILDLAEIPPHRWEFAELRERLIQAVPKDSPIKPEEFADVILGAPRLVGKREEIAASTLTADQVRTLVEEAKKNIFIVEKNYGAEATRWLCGLLRTGIVLDIQNPEHLSSAILRADSDAKLEFCILVGIRAKILSQITDAAFEAIEEAKTPKGKSANAMQWHEWATQCQLNYVRNDTALNAYRTAIEIDPTRPEIWSSYAMFLDVLGLHNDEAARAYEKAVSLEGVSAFTLLQYGAFLGDKLNSFQQAESMLQRAVQIAPEISWIWFQLGVIQFEHLGKFTEAERNYRSAIRIDPKNSHYWMFLGELLSRYSQRKHEAEAAMREALRIDPENELCLIRLALFMQTTLGTAVEVESLLRKAVEINPQSELALSALAIFLEDSQAREKEALNLWFDVLSINPGHFTACLTLGQWFSKRGDIEKAQKFFEQAARHGTLAKEVKLAAQALFKHQQPETAAHLIANAEQRFQDEDQMLIRLYRSILAAHDENWGQASALIRGLIERLGDRAMFPKEQQDDWLTLTAALLHYGYGEKLLELLADTGADQKLRPWSEAIRAMLRGDKKYLRNTPVEVRDSAAVLFAQIESHLATLPAETRRWNPSGASQGSSRRKKRG
jgi:Tfp pilus assembly protein PilF